MSYYNTNHLGSTKNIILVSLFLMFCIAILLYLKSNSTTQKTQEKQEEYEYVPNEVDSDEKLLEPLSSETNFPGGMPSYLQKTRHDPEILNIEDNLDVKKK